MKWMISIALAVLAGWFAWFQWQSTKVAYVNGLAPYDVVPGREFILQHPACVFAWKKKSMSGFPLLGAHVAGARTSVPELPAQPTAVAVGAELPEVRILEVIPSGTRLLITSVRREESRSAGVVITYEAKLLDEVQRAYQKVDLRPVLLPVAHPGDVPEIDDTILVPWIKR
jgi:hypothetical protein